MKRKKERKIDLFMVFVVLSYIFALIYNPSLSFQALKNSGYYIKEMLLIMPVIFILTALLDIWVPKDLIMKYLGKESKIKGILYSFILGSISAGPIYAAFPIAVMLLKKGASIRNIIIILSSWAVIKIPMLINEVKFLGLNFMIIRWILTIIAITIFSYIASLIVKKEEVLVNKEITLEKNEININRVYCIGCGLCQKLNSKSFELKNKKAYVLNYKNLNKSEINKIIESCPVNAIYKKN